MRKPQTEPSKQPCLTCTKYIDGCDWSRSKAKIPVNADQLNGHPDTYFANKGMGCRTAYLQLRERQERCNI